LFEIDNVKSANIPAGRTFQALCAATSTDAVLVLVFAKFAGIAWAGVAAVAAMSFGTAITVSMLAVVAVQLRKIAMRLMGVRYQFATYAGHVFTLSGGSILIALGYGLFVASYSQAVRLMGL